MKALLTIILLFICSCNSINDDVTIDRHAFMNVYSTGYLQGANAMALIVITRTDSDKPSVLIKQKLTNDSIIYYHKIFDK